MSQAQMSLQAGRKPLKPGIRGALIVVLIILVLRAVMLPGILVYAVFGGADQASLKDWWNALVSTSGTGRETIALIYRASCFLLMMVLNIMLLTHFLKKRKGIGTFLFAVLAVQVFLDVGDALISTFLTPDQIGTGNPGQTGLVFGLAVMQYLNTSERARVTFTR